VDFIGDITALEIEFALKSRVGGKKNETKV
jgi:hypothetical protein